MKSSLPARNQSWAMEGLLRALNLVLVQPGKAVRVRARPLGQDGFVVSAYLRPKREVLRRDAQLREWLHRNQTGPLRDVNLHALRLKRRLTLEGRSREQVEHPLAPGLLRQRLPADREEVEGNAEFPAGLPHLKAAIHQRHGMLVAVENGEVHRPESIRRGIDGAAIAELVYIVRLARLELLDVRIPGAVQRDLFVLREVLEKLPLRSRQRVADLPTALHRLREQRLERADCLCV